MSNLVTTSPRPEPATSAEAEARLEAQSALIQARLDALQQEVMTTGDAVKQAVAENPWVSVGGGAAAGLVVGLVFGGSKKKRKQEVRILHGDREEPALVGTQPQPGAVRALVSVAFTALVSGLVRQGVYKLLESDQDQEHAG
jgi:hypothetical protein